MHGTRKRERARCVGSLEVLRGTEEAWVSVGRRRFEKWEEAWISVAHRRWEAWSDAPWDGPGARKQERIALAQGVVRTRAADRRRERGRRMRRAKRQAR